MFYNEHDIWFLSFLFCLFWINYSDFFERFVSIGFLNYNNEETENKNGNSLKEEMKNSTDIDNNVSLQSQKDIVSEEDKYMDLFKKCPTDYIYTFLDFEYREQKKGELLKEYEEKFHITKQELKQKFDNLASQYRKLLMNDIEDIHVDTLISTHNIDIEPPNEYEYKDEDSEEYIEQFKVLLISMCKKRLEEYTEEFNNIKAQYAQEISAENIEKVSFEEMKKNKLSGLMNNYMIEFCPLLGNVIMRFNSDKMSFEYFSDKSVPFRFLEVIARKYVATYLCKPLYVCLEKETKAASVATTKLPKFSLNFASQNRDKLHYPAKNGVGSFPSQMMNKKPMINMDAFPQKQTNRYTYAGLLRDFTILKPIDRKIVDKKYATSYKEFKMKKGN